MASVKHMPLHLSPAGTTLSMYTRLFLWSAIYVIFWSFNMHGYVTSGILGRRNNGNGRHLFLLKSLRRSL
jgi:hypothetical protein